MKNLLFYYHLVWLLKLVACEQMIGGFRQYRLVDPPQIGVSSRILTDQYFEQRLDHFNPTDTRTWQQRYHLSENYYNEDSKNHFFLMLGGEWEATSGWLSGGAWINTAQKYGALLIYLEHRYYGESHPFSDLTTENLQYLNAHQALEDAANFIEGINRMYNVSSTEAKWIIFGGSYAGTLASWLKQKYSHLVAGAMDSSGPLDAILDFHQYYQVVRESLATHSESCVDNIRDAFDQLEELTSGCIEETQSETISELFALCTSIDEDEITDKDIMSLYESIAAYSFATIVQYNGFRSITIDTVCDIMVDESIGTALERLGNVFRTVIDYFGGTCISYEYDTMIEYMQDTTIYASRINRQWYYQTCTEYGFYQTFNQPNNPIFGSQVTASYYTELCEDIFGAQFNETLTNLAIEATNVRYGGINITTPDIIHFHGSIDPWHALGKLETTNDIGDYVQIVEGVSHCANLYTATANDPAELAEAQEEADIIIGSWLGVVEEVETSLATSPKSITLAYLICLILLAIW